MALIPRVFGNSVFDPFFHSSILDPFEGLSRSLFDQAFPTFDKDVSAVANTRVDWVETPEAHVFKADLLVSILESNTQSLSWVEGRVVEFSNMFAEAVSKFVSLSPAGCCTGLKKEEIKIQVAEDGILSISGERRKEKVDEKDSYRREERSYGKFYRQFKLPSNSKPDNVSAKVENGVLTVTVPKEVESQNAVRNVEIQG